MPYKSVIFHTQRLQKILEICQETEFGNKFLGEKISDNAISKLNIVLNLSTIDLELTDMIHFWGAQLIRYEVDIFNKSKPDIIVKLSDYNLKQFNILDCSEDIKCSMILATAIFYRIQKGISTKNSSIDSCIINRFTVN